MLYVDKDDMKEQGIRFLKRLDVLPEFIENFSKKDILFIFEDGTGYDVAGYGDIELIEKIRQVEQEKNIKVYAVIKSIMKSQKNNRVEEYQLYDFLYIDDESETWDCLFSETREVDKYVIYSYCWNRTREEYSEFGRIIVKSFGGGLYRIG